MNNDKNKLPTKIKITESQYKRIFSGDIQIIGDEFAYKNPAQLNEQLMAWVNDATNWLDKNIGDPISNAADFVTDGIVNGATDIGNTVANAATELYNYTNGNSGTEVMNDIIGIVDQGTKPMRDNIDHNWDWWVKYDWPYIKRDIENAFKEIPDALWVEGGNFKRMYDLFTDVETYKALSGGFKIMFKTLADPEEYKKVPEGFKQLFDELASWPERLVEWLKTWTVQDFIDLAAIICFIIPHPAAWAIGFGLEGLNVGISVYKGNYSEAGIRLFFVVGGALLSKAVSATYKVSAEVLEESTETIVKIAKVAQEEGQVAAQKTLAKLTKGSDAETKKFIQDVFEKINKDGKIDFSAFDKVKSQMVEIKTLSDKYIAQGISETKAINRATKETVGETFQKKYLRHVGVETKFERILLGSVSAIALSLKFKNFLEGKGLNDQQIAKMEKTKEEQVSEVLVSIDGINDLTEDLIKERIKIESQLWEKESENIINELEEKYPDLEIGSDGWEDKFILEIEKSYGEMNEEIIRIKELFTNERLYGNLIS